MIYKAAYHQHKGRNPGHAWLRMILPSGVVYMVNRIGPSTDPCRTPYFSVICSNGVDPIRTIEVYPEDMLWASSEYPISLQMSDPINPKLHSDLEVLMWLLLQNPQLRLYQFALEAGPCITNVIATCRKNFSQWESSFLWKLRCHWLKFLRRVAKTLVIQGPGLFRCCGVVSMQIELTSYKLSALMWWTSWTQIGDRSIVLEDFIIKD